MRLKRPAAVNIGLDLDPEVIGRFHAAVKNDLVVSPAAAVADPIAGSVEGRRRRRSPAAGVRVGELGGPIAESVGAAAPVFVFKRADALAFLRRYPFTGAELVYCDPPYMHETRGRANLYLYELTDRQHLSLLSLLRRLPCSVMLSGYWTRTYGDALKDWHSVTFQTVNRAGQRTTEVLWSNFPEPVALHDYRERIKRKKNRWVTRLRSMPILERRALLHAITEAWAVPAKFPRAGLAGAGDGAGGAPGDRLPPFVAVEACVCDNSRL
jgi:hypothetical protein